MEEMPKLYENISHDQSINGRLIGFISVLLSTAIILFQFYVEAHKAESEFWEMLVNQAKQGKLIPYIYSLLLYIPFIFVVISQVHSLLVKCFCRAIPTVIRRRNQGLCGAILILFITFIIYSSNQEWYSVELKSFNIEAIKFKYLNIYYLILIQVAAAIISFIIILFIDTMFLDVIINSLIVYTLILFFLISIQEYMICAFLGSMFAVFINMFLTDETRSKLKTKFKFKRMDKT